MKQLIYRRDGGEVIPGLDPAGFSYCRSLADLVPLAPALVDCFGRMGYLKMRLKLLAGRRVFFCICSDGKLTHYGWVALGFCNYYKIDKGSAVIAPVWTRASERGKGLATQAIKQVINCLLRSGTKVVYIDTSEDNLAMLHVIRCCGFRTLAGTYVRKSDNAPGQALRVMLKALLPICVFRQIRRLSGGEKFDRARWQQEYNTVLSQAVRVPVRPELPRVGIVKDKMLRHSYYEAACLELGVPYTLIDLASHDWIQAVRQSDCAAYLVRPFVLTSAGKRLYDERVRILAEDLGQVVYPSEKSLWLYESKRRTAAWLDAHAVSQPATWVFDEETTAHAFARTCPLPILFKTDLGSEALGVRIMRDRTSLLRLVRRCFTKGVGAEGYDQPAASRGEMLLQEFIPNAREWRMVRIGNSYFGHRKGKTGDFHSGSKIIEFDTPPERLLRFVKDVTDKGPFDNMALDILETETGAYLVIELHSYFGCNSPHVMLIDGQPGRYRYMTGQDAWSFETGDFNRNASCNLRVERLLDLICQKES